MTTANRLPPVPFDKPKLKRCILHIGSSKTGTSSIQYCLKRNIGVLRQKGVLYPSNTDRGNHHTYFGSAFLADPTLFQNNIKTGLDVRELAEARDRESMQFLLDEVSAFDGDTLLISSEYLSFAGEDSCRAMADWLGRIAATVTILCYVRHPLGHATSAAQQKIRVGHATIAEAEEKGTFFRPSKRLKPYIDVFGRDRIVVRPFERGQMKDGNVIADFFETIGVATDGIEGLDRREANASLSYEAALIADALNRKVPRTVNGTWNPARAKVVKMTDLKGSKFGLSQDSVSNMQKRVKTELAYMKKEFGIVYEDAATSLRLDPEPVWDETSIGGIALQINDLSLHLQHAKAEISYLRSREALAQGKLAEAIKLAANALDRKPESMGYLRHLCKLLMEAGRHKRAVAQIERFLKLKPGHAPALKLLALVKARAAKA